MDCVSYINVAFSEYGFNIGFGVEGHLSGALFLLIINYNDITGMYTQQME